MFLAHLLHSVIEDDWKVLHIVNHEQVFSKTTHVVSERNYSDRRRSPLWLRDSKERFSNETWTTVEDLCAESLPYEDKEFDFVICDHSLVTLRDPLVLCKEMQRVGKKGYIEFTSAIMSFVEGVEREGVVGYPHHRWFVDVYEGKLRFAFRNHLIQSLKEYHIQKPEWAKGVNPLKSATGVFWDSSFEVYEDKEISVFPDWHFEEVFGNEWNKRPEMFFLANHPVPVLVNETPFKPNTLVTNKELDVKFGVSLVDENGRPSMDMYKFETILEQQGKL